MGSAYVSYALTEVWLAVFSVVLYGSLTMSIGSEYEVKRLKGCPEMHRRKGS